MALKIRHTCGRRWLAADLSLTNQLFFYSEPGEPRLQKPCYSVRLISEMGRRPQARPAAYCCWICGQPCLLLWQLCLLCVHLFSVSIFLCRFVDYGAVGSFFLFLSSVWSHPEHPYSLRMYCLLLMPPLLAVLHHSSCMWLFVFNRIFVFLITLLCFVPLSLLMQLIILIHLSSDFLFEAFFSIFRLSLC